MAARGDLQGAPLLQGVAQSALVKAMRLHRCCRRRRCLQGRDCQLYGQRACHHTPWCSKHLHPTLARRLRVRRCCCVAAWCHLSRLGLMSADSGGLASDAQEPSPAIWPPGPTFRGSACPHLGAGVGCRCMSTGTSALLTNAGQCCCPMSTSGRCAAAGTDQCRGLDGQLHAMAQEHGQWPPGGGGQPGPPPRLPPLVQCAGAARAPEPWVGVGAGSPRAAACSCRRSAMVSSTLAFTAAAGLQLGHFGRRCTARRH